MNKKALFCDGTGNYDFFRRNLLRDSRLLFSFGLGPEKQIRYF